MIRALMTCKSTIGKHKCIDSLFNGEYCIAIISSRNGISLAITSFGLASSDAQFSLRLIFTSNVLALEPVPPIFLII